MHFPTALVTILSMAASTIAQPVNTTPEYYLRTQLKGDQSHKAKFNDLWLLASHTGAGLNDAVFTANKTRAARGFLNPTNISNPAGGFYAHQEFNLPINPSPYGMSISVVNQYSAWEPVRIDDGEGSDTQAFFINSTGLQWFDEPELQQVNTFGGWLVCDWWHGVPQLFSKWS